MLSYGEYDYPRQYLISKAHYEIINSKFEYAAQGMLEMLTVYLGAGLGVAVSGGGVRWVMRCKALYAKRRFFRASGCK